MEEIAQKALAEIIKRATKATEYAAMKEEKETGNKATKVIVAISSAATVARSMAVVAEASANDEEPTMALIAETLAKFEARI